MPLPLTPVRRLVAALLVMCACLVAPATATVARADDNDVRPVAECVVVNGDGTFTAFFGYTNRSSRTQTITGSRNTVTGGTSSGTPTVFAPGRVVAAFSVTSSGSRITWNLDGRSATASPSSTPCSTNPSVPEAPVALLLMLAPAVMTGWWLHRRRPRPC
jgi:hypothetical protein